METPKGSGFQPTSPDDPAACSLLKAFSRDFFPVPSKPRTPTTLLSAPVADLCSTWRSSLTPSPPASTWSGFGPSGDVTRSVYVCCRSMLHGMWRHRRPLKQIQMAFPMPYAVGFPCLCSGITVHTTVQFEESWSRVQIRAQRLGRRVQGPAVPGLAANLLLAEESPGRPSSEQRSNASDS